VSEFKNSFAENLHVDETFNHFNVSSDGAHISGSDLNGENIRCSEGDKSSVRIPENLDLDVLFEGDTRRKDVVRMMKDSCAYFISLLCVDNYTKFKSKNGFRKIKTTKLESVIGKGGHSKRRSSEVKKLLIQNGVIEMKNHRMGKYSQSFRLMEKYNIGKFKQHELGGKLLKRLEVIKKNKEKNILESTTHCRFEYQIIKKQFQKNVLKINSELSEQFLRNLGRELLERVLAFKRYEQFNLKALFNFIGRQLKITDDLNQGRVLFNISDSNHRFNSIITSLPKILRPFLLINGQRIAEVDISSSQPFILASILNESFLDDKEGVLNMDKIFPELKERIEALGLGNFSRQSGRTENLLGIFLTKEERRRIEDFKQIDFANDFYQSILEKGQIEYPEIIQNNKGFLNGRDFIKKKMMSFLFYKSEDFRPENPVIYLMEKLFPELNTFIIRFHSVFGNKEFSILLQRVEVELLLNVVRKISNESEEIPFYTIHDCILTSQKYAERIESIMRETIEELTQMEVGIKIKNLNPKTEVDASKVKECFKKIKIGHKKKWEKSRTYILTDNIKAGIHFMFPESRVGWYERCGVNDESIK
jgi:hypothetical protein